MDIVERAKELAHRAHAGQVDKAGRPYIEHVARVASAFGSYDDAATVAWLHDVIEDCPAYEAEVIGEFPLHICAAVIALTKRPGIETDFYWNKIRANPLARVVKLADISDNADEARLALLDPPVAQRLRKKYARARAILLWDGE